MSNFRVGMKVVCVKGASQSLLTKGNWAPKTGGVYTVRGIYDGPERVDLHLEEYVHPGPATHPDGTEYGWDSSRFRPVVERKTSIEVFKAMLNKPRVTVSA